MMDLDPASARCLERTRSAVMNILVAVGAGIAVSGVILGRRDRGALLWPPRAAELGAHAALIGLIAASFLTRRVLGSRTALRDPARRGARFYRAHVAGAAVGALAIPLGFAFGWAIRPRIDAMAPFWVCGLALGALALPRVHELNDFAEPMTDPNPTARFDAPPLPDKNESETRP